MEGEERGAPFVPQEPADGCNPFQNAHWKSIKTGWTWCLSAEAGATFLGEVVGVPQKKHKVGSNKRLWCLPAKKLALWGDTQGEWIATPSNEGPAQTLPRLRWTQLPSPHHILGLTSPAGGTTTKTSKLWHHALIRLLRDTDCGRMRGTRQREQREGWRTDGWTGGWMR